MSSIIVSALLLGVIGIVVGVVLCIASEKFSVQICEKEDLVRRILPGNNCGACGYPGCDGLARAIANGLANVNSCPVGGNIVAKKISEIMGVEAVEQERKVAFVRCIGNQEKSNKNYNYKGEFDCNMLLNLPAAGDKSCEYGCLGYGSCVNACEFDALHIVLGIAKVSEEKCVACGKCIDACPKKLIELVPFSAKHIVQCRSNDKGKDVKTKCSVGCIACTLCTKVCKFDAIHMQNNVAKIDYLKCTNCGECALKCPTKVIKSNNLGVLEVSA